MADLKKRFIDILFEDENEEELAEDSNYEQDVETSSEPKKESTILARDVLYRKNGASAFINLNETPRTDIRKNEEKPEEYEFSSQISPIFGLIKENEKKTVSVNPDIIQAQTNKPSDSHLDIITSPFYGYANKEDAQKNNYDVRSAIEENEEEELHHLFDKEEETLNSSYDDLDSNPLEDEEISLFRLFGENK